MSAFVEQLAAATGSTGTATHTGIALSPAATSPIACNFIVEAVGATPTITYKFQVSADPTTVSDANSTWYDLLYFTPTTNDTAATTTRTVTAVGSDTVFADLANGSRFWRKIRVVTSSNTNVTYRASVLQKYAPYY